MSKQKVLILGVAGMLGHTLFHHFLKADNYEVSGTARSVQGMESFFTEAEIQRITADVDADNFDTVTRALTSIQPDIVINCIGLVKQLPISSDPLTAITINAQLPHRISMVCKTANARLIHISTDCVFSGQKGNYSEEDFSDAKDLYGRTKYLGEVDYPHCITLRTSIIGHELSRKVGLVEWFLSQEGKIKGYTNAIYSGFPTIEMSRIIYEYVIPNKNLYGLYHVSSSPISKYNLLRLISSIYEKEIEIEPYDGFYCDRSLDSTRFRNDTGYIPPSWQELVRKMHQHHIGSGFYQTN